MGPLNCQSGFRKITCWAHSIGFYDINGCKVSSGCCESYGNVFVVGKWPTKCLFHLVAFLYLCTLFLNVLLQRQSIFYLANSYNIMDSILDANLAVKLVPPVRDLLKLDIKLVFPHFSEPITIIFNKCLLYQKKLNIFTCSEKNNNAFLSS